MKRLFSSATRHSFERRIKRWERKLKPLIHVIAIVLPFIVFARWFQLLIETNPNAVTYFGVFLGIFAVFGSLSLTKGLNGHIEDANREPRVWLTIFVILIPEIISLIAVFWFEDASLIWLIFGNLWLPINVAIRIYWWHRKRNLPPVA